MKCHKAMYPFIYMPAIRKDTATDIEITRQNNNKTVTLSLRGFVRTKTSDSLENMGGTNGDSVTVTPCP